MSNPKIQRIRLAGTDYDIYTEKDWDQNDSEANEYIKNRTHYYKTEDILTDWDYYIHLSWGQDYPINPQLIPGETYVITGTYFDYNHYPEPIEVVEKFIFPESGEYVTDNYFGLNPDAPAKFKFTSNSISFADSTIGLGDPYTISLKHEVLKQLDPKYIPIDNDTLVVKPVFSDLTPGAYEADGTFSTLLYTWNKMVENGENSRDQAEYTYPYVMDGQVDTGTEEGIDYDIVVPDSVTNIYPICKTIVLPETTTHFEGSEFVYTVYVKATTPPSLDEYAFFEQTDVIIYDEEGNPQYGSNNGFGGIIVPVGCGEIYKTTGNWSLYAKYITEGEMPHGSTIKQVISTSLPLERGGVENSLQTPGATALTSGSIATGASLAGCRGYYMEAVDFTNKKIYLSTTQSNPPKQGAGTYIYDFDCGYAVGHSIYTMNKLHYYPGQNGVDARITEIDGNIITYSGSLGYSEFTDSAIADYDYSLIIPTYPLAGKDAVDLKAMAIAIGNRNKAIGRLSFAMGQDNSANQDFAFAGGKNTTAGYNAFAYALDSTADSNYSAVLGGRNNHVEGDAFYSAINGGRSNKIRDSKYSFIGGGGADHDGDGNIIDNTSFASIVGGNTNKVESSKDAFIGGGWSNHISSAGSQSAILGGRSNVIDSGSNSSAIIAGLNNHVSTEGAGAIVGGTDNSVTRNYGFIGGGSNNSVEARYGAIVGGLNNKITEMASFVAGSQLVSNVKYQAIFGLHNEPDTNAAFIVARGTNDDTVAGQRNIFTIDKIGGVVAGLGVKNYYKDTTISESKHVRSQFVFGTYNTPVADAKMVVGIGSSDANRNNGLVVWRDGRVTAGAGPSSNMDLTTKQYVDNKVSSKTDTKNTTGATNTSNKIYLVGATSQSANPITYTHDTAYVNTDGCLYSDSSKVITESTLLDENSKIKASLFPDIILGQMKFGGILPNIEPPELEPNMFLINYSGLLMETIINYITENKPSGYPVERLDWINSVYLVEDGAATPPMIKVNYQYIAEDNEAESDIMGNTDVYIDIPEGFYFISNSEYLSTRPIGVSGNTLHVGDWLVSIGGIDYSQATWEIICNTDTVRTVNGQIGDVVLRGDNIKISSSDSRTIKQYIDALISRIAELEDIINNITTLGVTKNSNGQLTITE